MLRQLVLDQALGRLLETFLDLTNADRPKPSLRQRRLDQEISEEMRLARAASPMCTLVARRIEQRPEHLGGRNIEHAHDCFSTMVRRISVIIRIASPFAPLCSTRCF